MVSPDYMTERPSPPSAAQVFFDQHVIPAAIDGLACLERVAERLAQGARRRPGAAVAAAIGIGFLLARQRRKRN